MNSVKVKKWRLHLLYAYVIRFFVTRECQEIQKIDKNSWYWQRKSSYLLNDQRNFNKIFRKDVTYGNIKSHKKPGVHPLSRRYIFEKTIGRGVKLTLPSLLRANNSKQTCRTQIYFETCSLCEILMSSFYLKKSFFFKTLPYFDQF